MFEDSLMESGGQISSRSKWWAIATFALNLSILSVFVLIPIINPEALPRQTLAKLLVSPRPPAPPVSPAQAPVKSTPVKSAIVTSPLLAPRIIPTRISTQLDVASAPPAVGETFPGGMPGGLSNSLPGGLLEGPGTSAVPLVKVAIPKKVALTSRLAAGNLINRITPVYPSIAKAARIQGTVVVQATISKTGVIENARAISGPEMLKQAAVEGVRSARYKPYLLNGEPVEVETNVNVIFSLGG